MLIELTSLRWVLTSKPSMIALPEVIGNSPVNIPNVVVLPAPVIINNYREYLCFQHYNPLMIIRGDE